MVGKARAVFADPLDGQKHRLKSVLELLDCIARDGISFSCILELGAQWGAVVAPLCMADLATDPDMGLPVFDACVLSLHSRLSEFLHDVAVYRRDESIRSWRNWILEDPLVHPYRWLQPDLVPASPFLCCDPDITPGGGGGLLSDLILMMNSLGRPGFPFSAGQTEGSLIPLFSMQKLVAGCRQFRKLSSLLLLGKTFFDVVQ